MPERGAGCNNTALTPFQGYDILHSLPRAALRLPRATCPQPRLKMNKKDIIGNAKDLPPAPGMLWARTSPMMC